MNTKLRFAVLPVALIAALGAVSANAASTNSPQTADFTVSITIENDCTITADNINFGTVSEVNTAHTASGQVHVTCSSQGQIDVTLNAGTGTGSSLASRQMDDGAGNAISYNLYNDSGHTTISGDGTTGSKLFSGTSTGAQQDLDVYAQTDASQGVKPVGSYSSTVTATVTF